MVKRARVAIGFVDTLARLLFGFDERRGGGAVLRGELAVPLCVLSVLGRRIRP
jgi:hypothetical protein